MGTVTKHPDPGSLLRRWRRAYRDAARRDGFRRILETHGYDPDGENADGGSLVEGLAEVVAFVLAARSIDGTLDASEVKRFLALQRYGGSPATGWCVRMGPCPEVELFVESLDGLDFEDLLDRFGFGHLDIAAIGREVTEDEARAIVEHVRQDVSFDGDEYELEVERQPSGVFIGVREADGEA